MATKGKKRSNIHFEVILPSDEGFSWTLYKGKQRVVSEGSSGSVEEARTAIREFKKSKGIPC